jgi:hypothetical protein
MTKPSAAALEKLFDAVVNDLTRRIENDEATAADLGVAVNLLKYNKITAALEENTALSELQRKLEEKRKQNSGKVVPMRPTAGKLSQAEVDDLIDNASTGT